MRSIAAIFCILALFFTACNSAVPTLEAPPEAEPTEAQEAIASQFEPALITNDEGGPVLVSGEFAWTSSYIPRHFKEPVAVLLDVSNYVINDYTQYVSADRQIMGVLTKPLAPAPTAYEVELPIAPDGQLVDLDNDGKQDLGVMVYAVLFGSNLVGDSYLEQIEQETFSSILSDPLTGNIRQGTLLIYAPDDQQGFPASSGTDGFYFTDDDPTLGLPAGYTLATLSQDGEVKFDRPEVATMDILEPASQASPDFSDQGFLESFNSLIDLLKVRYSYTELRGLDWEAIRAEYLPRLEQADQEGDSQAYFFALIDLANSIRDAHVYVSTKNFIAQAIYLVQRTEPYQGGFGVQIKELSDGRFVVTYLDPEGPGAAAGWQVGTEVLGVDGVPLADRIKTIPVLDAAGNPEAIRLGQLNYVLGFPVDSQVEVEYLQSEEDQPRSATLTASYTGGLNIPQPQFDYGEEISFKRLENGVYYIQWDMFLDDAYKIAVWQKFLSEAKGAPGIIIDLRRNGGGGTGLMYTMLSYLFPADDPALRHWIDSYVYDEQIGDLVLEFSTDYRLSSPDPDLTYTGPVAVLVSERSASAAEYFPQFLQRQGRVVVVGEHGTEGAGGFLETVAMPSDLTFYFTKGRTTFAGTEELNLEAKGVTLDVRVPITLENELAKQAGRDVVLEAGLETIQDETTRKAAEQLTEFTWGLTSIQRVDAIGNFSETIIDDPSSITITFGAENQLTIQADCNQAAGEYSFVGNTIQIELGPTTLAACPEGSQGETFLELLPGEKEYQIVQEEGKTILALIAPFEMDVPPVFLVFKALE